MIYFCRYLGTAISDRYLFIMLEYIPGGSIASMLAKFRAFSELLINFVFVYFVIVCIIVFEILLTKYFLYWPVKSIYCVCWHTETNIGLLIISNDHRYGNIFKILLKNENIRLGHLDNNSNTSSIFFYLLSACCMYYIWFVILTN